MALTMSKFVWAVGVAGWIAISGVSYGGQIISTPAGLHNGDQFRIVFVTSQLTTGTSSDTQYYDDFATASANSVGGFSYQGQALTWKAIVSTSSTSAISRLNDSVPLYLINGTEVATNSQTATFWNTLYQPLAHDINLSEDGTGTGSQSPPVWTGTYYTGESFQNYFGTIRNHPLGSDTPYAGNSVFSNGGWTSYTTLSNTTLGSVYAFSDVLTVGSASPVPEPSSLVLLGFGGVVLAIGTYRRRCSVHACQFR